MYMELGNPVGGGVLAETLLEKTIGGTNDFARFLPATSSVNTSIDV